MRYHSMGSVPAKRHVQTREDGRLLVEEVMGYEGFSGNESILYHLQSPCRVSEVGSFTPIEGRSGCPTPTSTGSPTRSRSGPRAIRYSAAGS